MTTRMVVVSATTKRALIEFAETVKCHRFAILNPYPQDDGTYEVLRVVDSKSGKITNPTSWYNGLDCEIGDEARFDWLVCQTSYYRGRVHVDYTSQMRASCPPRNRHDGKTIKSW